MVLPPKRCFSFRRISDLEICFELVVQRGLEHTDIQNSISQRDRSGVRCDEVADINMVMNINTSGLAEGLGLETDGEDMQNPEHSYFSSAAHAAKAAESRSNSHAISASTRPPHQGTFGHRV